MSALPQVRVLLAVPLAGDPTRNRAIVRDEAGTLATALWDGSDAASAEITFSLAGAAQIARAILAGNPRSVTEPGAMRKLAAGLLVALKALETQAPQDWPEDEPDDSASE